MYKVSQIWKLNGAAIAEPNSFETELSDAEAGSFRTVDGRLHRKLTARGLRTVRFGYALISGELLSEIIDGMDRDYFTLTCPDPEEGETELECCCKKLSGSLLKLENGEATWSDVQFVCVQR